MVLLLQHEPGRQVGLWQGFRALMLASREGRDACVELLLGHEPDSQVGAANKDGSTALSLAVLRGHDACAALLRAHGATE